MIEYAKPGYSPEPAETGTNIVTSAARFGV